VETRRFPSGDGLRVTDADAVIAYIKSMRVGNELTDAAADQIRDYVDTRIEREGFFYCRTDAGLFIASEPVT
jgi:hypothetical protein